MHSVQQTKLKTIMVFEAYSFESHSKNSLSCLSANTMEMHGERGGSDVIFAVWQDCMRAQIN